MSWFDYTEQKRTLLIAGTIATSLAMLIVTARRSLLSFDGYWHLKTGLVWLQDGVSPWRDHFSFTFSGEAVTGPPFLFQALIAWLVNTLGLKSGFEAFELTSFLLTFGFVLFFLKKLRSPAILYCVVLPLVVVLIQFRSIARPELLSYVFIVWAVMMVHRAKGRIRPGNMLPVVALMLIWSNYHSPILGYIIFMALFIDAAVLQYQEKAPLGIWLQWLAWGFLVVAVGFLNHDLSHPLLRFMNFSPEWKTLIQEYESAALFFSGVAGFYVFIALIFITSALCVWKRKFGYVFVCVLLGYFCMTMARLVTPSGLVILCVLAAVVSEIDIRKSLLIIPRTVSQLIGFVVLLMIVLGNFSGISLARAFMEENRTSELSFPVDVADYIVNAGKSGRIFNEYQAGGYLIYRLSPESSVYIDGRTDILYPVEHYQRFIAAKSDPEILRNEIEEYEIDMALLENKQSTFQVMHKAGKFKLDYMGAKFSLFTRDEANFPIAGLLLAQPACWNQEMGAGLNFEQTVAILTLPQGSELISFLVFASGITNAEDKATYMVSLDKSKQWSNSQARFVAYQALRENLDEFAFQLFVGIQDKEFKDYLAAAFVALDQEKWALAEQLVNEAAHTGWSYISKADIEFALRIIKVIAQNSQLQHFSAANLLALYSQVDATADTVGDLNVGIGQFCYSSLADSID